MFHIPFLKDALYLRPEAEAVQKFLEGFPRKIVWLESLWLDEKEMEIRRQRSAGFKDTLILVTFSQQLSASSNTGGWAFMMWLSWSPSTLCVCSSVPAAGGTRVQKINNNNNKKRWPRGMHKLLKEKCLVTPHWLQRKIALTNLHTGNLVLPAKPQSVIAETANKSKYLENMKRD